MDLSAAMNSLQDMLLAQADDEPSDNNTNGRILTIEEMDLADMDVVITDYKPPKQAKENSLNIKGEFTAESQNSASQAPSVGQQEVQNPPASTSDTASRGTTNVFSHLENLLRTTDVAQLESDGPARSSPGVQQTSPTSATVEQRVAPPQSMPPVGIQRTAARQVPQTKNQATGYQPRQQQMQPSASAPQRHVAAGADTRHAPYSKRRPSYNFEQPGMPHRPGMPHNQAPGTNYATQVYTVQQGGQFPGGAPVQPNPLNPQSPQNMYAGQLTPTQGPHNQQMMYARQMSQGPQSPTMWSQPNTNMMYGSQWTPNQGPLNQQMMYGNPASQGPQSPPKWSQPNPSPNMTYAGQIPNSQVQQSPGTMPNMMYSGQQYQETYQKPTKAQFDTHAERKTNINEALIKKAIRSYKDNNPLNSVNNMYREDKEKLRCLFKTWKYQSEQEGRVHDAMYYSLITEVTSVMERHIDAILFLQASELRDDRGRHLLPGLLGARLSDEYVKGPKT